MQNPVLRKGPAHSRRGLSANRLVRPSSYLLNRYFFRLTLGPAPAPAKVPKSGGLRPIWSTRRPRWLFTTCIRAERGSGADRTAPPVSQARLRQASAPTVSGIRPRTRNSPPAILTYAERELWYLLLVPTNTGSYGAKYPNRSRTKNVLPSANALISVLLVGTMAILLVMAPSIAFSVETTG
jgi:hypothetical protein